MSHRTGSQPHHWMTSKHAQSNPNSMCFAHGCYWQGFFAYFDTEMKKDIRISTGWRVLYATGWVKLDVTSNCSGRHNENRQNENNNLEL